MKNGENGISRRRLLAGAAAAASATGLGLGLTTTPASADNGECAVFIRYQEGQIIRRTPNLQLLHGGYAPNARLVSSLSSTHFLEVTDSGNLYDHRWNGSTFQPYLTGWGFDAANTRLIAGLDTWSFLEINTEDELALWTRTSLNSAWTQQVRGWGWSTGTTRLITGLTSTSFLEVQANGVLSRWDASGSTYAETVLNATGFTSANTRFVSGIRYNAFFELNTQNQLVYWTWDSTFNLTGSPVPAYPTDARLVA